jgi:hypothetical protein
VRWIVPSNPESRLGKGGAFDGVIGLRDHQPSRDQQRLGFAVWNTSRSRIQPGAEIRHHLDRAGREFVTRRTAAAVASLKR